jgi:hypothetical protein
MNSVKTSVNISACYKVTEKQAFIFKYINSYHNEAYVLVLRIWLQEGLHVQSGRVIAQVVSRWLPTAAARVRARSGHVGFVVDKVALG